MHNFFRRYLLVWMFFTAPFFSATSFGQNIQAYRAGPDIFKGLSLIKNKEWLESEISSRSNPGIIKNRTELFPYPDQLAISDVIQIYYELYGPKNSEELAIALHVLEYNSKANLDKALETFQKLPLQSDALFSDGKFLIFIKVNSHADASQALNSAVFHYSQLFEKRLKLLYIDREPMPISYAMEDAPTTTEIVAAVDEPKTLEAPYSATIVEKPEAAAVPNNKKDHLLLEHRAYGAMQNDSFDIAIALYKQLLALDPKHYRAYYNIAWMLATTKKLDAAIAIANKGITQVSDEEELGNLYKMIGNCWIDLAQFGKGIDYLSQSLKRNADDPIAQHNIGFGYFKSHEYDKAIYWFLRAVDAGYGENFNLGDVWFYVATSLSESGQMRQSLPFYDAALKDNPFYSYYYNKTEAYIKLGEMDHALQTANEMVARFPDKADAYFKRQQVYNLLGDRAKQKADLLKAHHLDPKEPDVLLDLAVWYQSNNEISKGLQLLRDALKNGAEADLVYANLGNLYSSNKLMKDSARFYYEKAIAFNPARAAHYYNFGNFHKNYNQNAQAIILYKKAIELDPSLALAYNNLSIMYRRQNDLEKAKEAIQKALELRPNDFTSNANRVGIAQAEDDVVNIEKYATLALSSMPQHPQYLEMLETRANARLKMGRTQDALYDYLDILKGFSDQEKKQNEGIYANIGYCYLEDEQLNEANYYFDQSNAIKSNVDAVLGLVMVCYIQKDEKCLQMTKTLALQLAPVLEKGKAGIKEHIAEGYFYTNKQMAWLEAIFGNQ